MTDQKKLWEKIDKLPGWDRNPFETPVGPTEECFSSNKLVLFVENGETNPDILRHLESCEACREHLDRFKKVMGGKE